MSPWPYSSVNAAAAADSSASPAQAAANAASSTGSTAYANATVDVPSFIFHIDLVLLAMAAVFVLFTLPRMFAAIGRPAHFFTGYFMRGPGSAGVPSLVREYAPRRVNPSRNVSTKTMQSARTAKFTDDSHTLNSHAHLLTMPSRSAMNGKHSVPTRVPSWITLTHPVIVSITNQHILPGVSALKAFVILLVFGVVAYAALYESNPFSNPVREGYIAMALFPIVIAVACKNNVLTWLAGVGYEKLNWLHRAMGTFLVLTADLHAAGFIYNWAINETFYAKMQMPKFQYGFVALGGVNLLYLGSRQVVREKSYTFFLITHFVGLIASIVGFTQHFPVTVPYVVAGVIVYAVDRVLRLARTRRTTAYLTPMDTLNNGTTHVHMPQLSRGFRAGQHVRIRVVEGSGLLAWIRALAFSRARPFSLAARPQGAGAELYIKKQGGAFTAGLYNMALGTGRHTSEKSHVKELSEAEAAQPTRAVTMLVEGPYGGPAYTLFESYSGVVLVAGGSGISFALGMLDNLLEEHAAGRSRVRAIEVVWSVADPASLTALLPVLRPLLRPRPSPHSALAIRMTVHYTRAGGRGPLPDPTRLPTGIHLRSGRPDLLRALEGAVDRVLDSRGGPAPHGTSGIAAAACGPPELVAQLEGAVGNLSWERWRDVGGVETVSEAFAF